MGRNLNVGGKWETKFQERELLLNQKDKKGKKNLELRHPQRKLSVLPDVLLLLALQLSFSIL